MSDYVVLCMKWGTLYGPDYVNVLYRAVRDNLKVPHRFVCLTDDTTGIDPGVECFPLPDPLMEHAFTRPGGWPKLTIYKPDLYGLKGRCLFVDLDSVICGDLEPMFREKGEIVVIREWRRFADYFRKWQVNGQTSIFAFTLGEMSYMYDAYAKDPEDAAREFRNEQRFVTAYARDMRFWKHPTIISFKRHLLAPPVLNRFIKPKAPWPGVSVLAFHGEPRPIDVVPDRGQVWGKPLRWGRGAVPFVRDYWLRYGGTEPEV